MASQLVISGTNFATTIIVLRSIGFDGFGQFTLCFLLIMVVRNFLCGMVLDAMAAVSPKLRAVSIPWYRGFLGVTVGTFALVSTALLAGATLPLAYVLGAPWLLGLALALAIANALSCVADFLSRYHFVHGQPVRAFLTDFARYGVQVAFIAALAVSDIGLLTPNTALYALAAGSLVGVMVGFAGQGRHRWSSRFARVVWPRHRNFVRWMSLSIPAETTLMLAPMFIGMALLGEAALGVVRSIQQMTNILNLPTNALLQVLPAKAAAIYSSLGLTSLQDFLRGTVRWIVGYFALIGILLAVFGASLARVIYVEVPPSFHTILFLLVLANFFFSVRMIVGIMFLSMERPDLVLRINAVGATIALIAPFIALVLGAEAIALSSAVAMSGALVKSLLTARRLTRDV